jgi:hypothetical protein
MNEPNETFCDLVLQCIGLAICILGPCVLFFCCAAEVMK